MDVIVSREKIKSGLTTLDGQIEGLYNLLYDHRGREMPSCYDAMLETMARTVGQIRREVSTAPQARQ